MPAWGAEVVSSNIVGYEKISLTANQMDIMSIQFQEIGDTLISLQNLQSEGLAEDGVDSVRIYDPATHLYTTAYYWGESADGGVYESPDAEDPMGAGWGDGQQNAIFIDLVPGQGLWAQSSTGGKIVVSGEVSTNNKIQLTANVMDLVANPLPMAVAIQNIKSEGLAEDGVDSIRIYDPATHLYTTAYYWGESADGGVYESPDAEDPMGAGWGDGQQNAIFLTIQPGQGFWAQSSTGGKLVFPKAE